MKVPRLTIRGRLTLVYGGLFFLAGLLLLGVTYLLMSHELAGGGTFLTIRGQPAGGPSIPPSTIGSGSDLGNAPPDALYSATRAAEATRTSAMNALLTQGGIALAVVGAIATAFGWLVAGRLLQPLHRMTATARRIADAPAADRVLHERIALDGPHDEIRELADTFDVMLARLDGAFDGQRRFIANASHEIRTPLALSRTLLEVALDGDAATPGERQLATTLLAVNARHERLIDGLLLLARSEQEIVERSYVDMADILEHVAEPMAEVTVTAGEAPTTGNPVLLERIVANLLDNAVRYNVPSGGWVRASTGTDPDGTVVLRVANTGPVVAPYDIPGLFEPFRRLAADRLVSTSGAGLGLSIVRAITRAHGGTVTAEPREGGGLVVTVTLPGA